MLAYEVLTAFFLEATFLGVMLFGMSRVPGWMHLAATLVVAIGTTISAFWILALNSWMQTPAGHVTMDGALIAGDWLQVLFNPSFPYRFVHMMLASGLTAAFVTAGLSAWRLLRAPGDAAALRTLHTGIVIAAVFAPLQIAAGDMHGLRNNPLDRTNSRPRSPRSQPSGSPKRESRSHCSLCRGRDAQRNDFAIELLEGREPYPEARSGCRDQGFDAFAPAHHPRRRSSSAFA